MGRTYPVVIGAMVLALASWIVGEAFSGEGGLHDYEVTALNKDWKIRLNQDVKVAGLVVENSLRGDLERLDVEFDIEDQQGSILTVTYKKLLPDPFDYGREVIIEGKVVGKGKLEARNITVKCPSRYQDGAMPEEEMPDKYRKSPLTVRAQQNMLDTGGDISTSDPVDFGAKEAAGDYPPVSESVRTQVEAGLGMNSNSGSRPVAPMDQVKSE